MRLVLASASPRRRELLAQLGLSFEVSPADIDEAVRPRESPRDYVERLARAKAAAVHQQDADVLALAADTSVVVDDDILGKPGASVEAGRAMLQRLSGREHQVMTGVAVAGERVDSVVVETTVRFRALTGPEIAWYVATHEGQDKAGGYAVQGKAGAFVTALSGSASNVIGLPLAETLALLEGAGLPMPWSPK
jgi:septum formation protein